MSLVPRGTNNDRRSLFVVEDMRTEERFAEQNVRSIQPGHGLAPKYLNDALGRQAALDIKRGTPLAWNLITCPLSITC